MPPTLEIAAFDPDSALAAAAGADRIELCRDVSAGGLTPPIRWVEAVAAQVAVPVVVMVRPHADGWTFRRDEHIAMRREARAAIRAGASGIVWGALRLDGAVDEPALRALLDTVGTHEVTFHRAFDAARDGNAALDVLLDCGVSRILTSGGPGDAHSNTERLAALVRCADGRLAVMPGGGVRAVNVTEIVRRTGAREVHSAARSPRGSRVDLGEVARLRAALDALG